MTWDDSCVVASPGAGCVHHPKVNAGTSRENGLDVAFLSSVCLGHEESGLGESPDDLTPIQVKNDRVPRQSSLCLDRSTGRRGESGLVARRIMADYSR